MVTATTTNSCDLANKAQNEKRPRRLWKSFSVESAGSELGPSSPGPGVEEVCQVSQLRYGSVVPALRLQLAEQGDTCAQVEVARELLLTVTTSTLAGEEVASLEERAVYWLLRAAEQGHTEARSTLQVQTMIIEAK